MKTIARLTVDYSPAVKAGEKYSSHIRDVEKTVASLQARLEKLSVASSKGAPIPGANELKTWVTNLRQAVASGQKISEEQAKTLLAAKRFADIHQHDAAVWQLKTKLAKEHTAQIAKAQKEAERAKILEEKRVLAEQKSIERATLRLPQLQAETALLQSNLRFKGMESTEIMAQANTLRQQIDLLNAKVMAGEKLTQIEAAQTQELQKQLTVLKSQAQTAIIEQPKRGPESFWERRFGWFVAGSIFYGSLRLAREMLDNMRMIERDMVTIQRISKETTADFEELRNELLRLGVQFGQTWSVVSDIATKWAQAGYNVRDTLELTETALYALNTAELDANEATQGMIALMAQWQLSAEDLLPVLDKINKTADSFAINSADLINGLTRASGAARVLGMSLEDTMAILTVMRESTGRTGREIGNALNSILSFIQRPQAMKVFRIEGIDIWADDAHSRMRNVMDIFADMAERWPRMSREMQDAFVEAAESAGLYTEELAEIAGLEEEWTAAQQRNLSQAAAGIYRRNFLLALLQNWPRVYEVLLEMEDSLGYTMRENQKTMETYEKKIYALKASWQEFAVGFMEAGLLDGMKRFVDLGKGVFNVLNSLPEPIRATNSALLLLVSTLGLLNMATKTFAGQSVMGYLSKLSWFAPLAAKPLPVVAGFLGGIAILRLIDEQKEYNRQLGVYQEELEKATKALEKHTEGTREHGLAQERVQDLLNQIGEKYPHVVQAMDEYGNVLLVNTEYMKKFSKERSDGNKVLESHQEKIEAIKDRLIELNRVLAEIDASRYTFPSLFPGDVAPEEGVDVGLDKINEIYRDRNEIIREQIRLGRELRELSEESKRLSEGKTATGIAFDSDEFGTRLDEALRGTSKVALSLLEVQKNLRLVDLEAQRLSKTTADLSELEEVNAQKTNLLAEENRLLAIANGELYQKLSRVKSLQAEVQRVISDPATDRDRQDALKFYDKLTDEVRSLTREINDNIVQIRENQIAIEDMGRAVREQYEKARKEMRRLIDEAFSYDQALLSHHVSMGRTQRDQQIAYLRELLEVYQDDYEKRWKIEEQLQKLYREGLEEQIDLVEDSYKRRIELIEEEAQARIDALQSEIDALDVEDEQARREEAERRHNEKLQQLWEEVRYHELRVGREHEEAILDLKKQISEEEIRWQNQVEEWERRDRKRALQRQIDDIRETAERQKREVERLWQETRRRFDTEYLSILSNAAVYQSAWYQRGLEWATQLAKGFEEGTSQLEAVLQRIGLGIGGARQTADLVSRSRDLLSAKRQWEEAYARGDTEGMRRAAELGQRIRLLGPTLDPNNDMTADELEEAIRRATAHTGASVLKGGFALLDKGELVLKPDFARQLSKLAQVLERGSQNAVASTVNNFIVDALMKAQTVEFSDEMDYDATQRLLRRSLLSLPSMKGVS